MEPKKPLAALIVAGAKPRQSEEPEEGDEMGLDAAVEDILNAVKTDDAQGLKAALRAFVDMCE